MAQVDTNIAMGFRPIQIESPVNQMAAISQLQSAQQQQQMNALKMQEAQRSAEQRNALARIRASGLDMESPEYLTRVSREVPDLADVETERQLKRLQLREAQETANLKQSQLTREQLKAAKKELLALPNLDAALKDIYDGVQSGLLTAEQGEALRAGLPTDEAEFPKWQQKQLLGYLTVEQQLSRTEPKIEKVDIGGAIKFLDVNPNSPTYNQEVGPKSITKTAAPVAPSRVVQLQAELASAQNTFGVNSPQAKQIQDEIEQETGGLERKRIEIDRYRSRKGEGGAGGVGGATPPTKLEKGERWNVAEQRIETVPGSKLHVAQSDKHNKDREALKGVETKTQSAINKIDELLSPKYIDGFRANFSGDIPYSGAVTQYFAPDARRRIDSLKSDMKAAGLELIRVGGSIGAMTQQEWPIVEQMIAALTPDMSAQEAETQVKKIRAYMEKIKGNAKDAYQTEWGDTQYFKPTEKPGGGGGGLSAMDKQALDWANSNPKDPRAAQIKQRLGVK
jgi:hypothetical protein